MIGFRPKPSALYIARSRLLKRLPDEPGYVVWLEAPYGYGKSVLAAQWAAELEEEGWRVLWSALLRYEFEASLIQLLDLPRETPRGVVFDTLWERPTLLVLEDLSGQESLSWLLKDVRGLVLLASRRALPYPELPRLMTEGRLIHLGAEALAFTLPEAEQLFGETERAKSVWAKTRGWPLPLHFAALTGEAPERHALLAGMRESLTDSEWEEALLLAALSHVPQDAATPATLRLAELGFAQQLEAGYRLHPLVADTVFTAHTAVVREVALHQAGRLPASLRGEAFERIGAYEALAELLETEFYLANHNPQAVLRWDRLSPGPRGPMRMLSVGWSLSVTDQIEDAVQLLLEASSHPAASPDHVVTALGWAVSCLAPAELKRAAELVSRGEEQLERASLERAISFLINVGVFYAAARDWQALELVLKRARAIIPQGHYSLALLQTNLAEMRWERWGDLEHYLAALEATVVATGSHIPYNLPANYRRLGAFKALLGQRDAALHHFEEAARWANHNPIWALVALAEKAALLGERASFPALFARCAAWQHPFAMDRVLALWAQNLREAGDAQGALALLAEREGVFIRAERALALVVLGRKDEAPQELATTSPHREGTLALQAARYRVSREIADLDALLALTLTRERILPGLVPLTELPQDRPELARAYPLAEVLRSNRKDAIAMRLAELPPLELEVLGRLQVRLLGQSLSLSSRQRELLVLLALRQPREAIGEALWPEADTTKMRNNLHVQLNLLRKLLEPWGVPTYLTEAGLVRTTCDLWNLEEALTKGDAETVLAGYLPPLAPGIDLPLVSQAGDDLNERVINLFLHAAKAAPPDRAEAYLDRLLVLDPLCEEALQHLLVLLIARGRRHEAQRRYHAFAKQLKEELGIEPLQRTLDLLSKT